MRAHENLNQMMGRHQGTLGGASCRSIAIVVNSLAPLTLAGATALFSCCMKSSGNTQF